MNEIQKKIVSVSLKHKRNFNMFLSMKKELRSWKVPKNRMKSMERVILKTFLPSTGGA